jgi:Fibronectin type III domain/Bacterial Ig-like domain (group 3)
VWHTTKLPIERHCFHEVQDKVRVEGEVVADGGSVGPGGRRVDFGRRGATSQCGQHHPAAVGHIHSHRRLHVRWQHEPGRLRAVGGLLFYNSLGQQITGGSTTTAPFASYVEGATSTGGTKAQLYIALPEASDPSGWSSFTLGNGATSFPNAGAPSNIAGSSLPVLTGSGSQQTLSSFVSENPDGANPDAGYYQLLLITSGSGANGTEENAADIYVDTTNDTWTLAYSYDEFDGGASSTPTPVGTTTTISSVTTSPVVAGNPIDLSASVADGDGSSPNGGTVQFYEKIGTATATTIGSPVTVAAGAATLDYTTSAADEGSDDFTAEFTPATGTNYSTSTSATPVAITVSGNSVTVPGAPTSPTEVQGKKSIAVKWVDPTSNGGSPITGYDVYCSTSSNPSTSGTPSATVSGATATTATVKGIKKGDSYYCVVTAVNVKGQSAPSPVASKPADTTKTAVTCKPKKAVTGKATTCTAKVTDVSNASDKASGTVAWSGGTGSFGSGGTCTLSAGSCSLGYTPSASGTQTLTAQFSGNTTQAPSSGTVKLKVT